MNNELPDIVFNLELLRLDHNARKHCTCNGVDIVVDAANRLVHCGKCGAVLEPFDALLRITRNYEAVRRDVEHLLEQRKDIAAYKPWLVTIKNLEHHYRGRKMLPRCPRCGDAFYLEDIKSWIGREYAERSGLAKDIE